MSKTVGVRPRTSQNSPHVPYGCCFLGYLTKTSASDQCIPPVPFLCFLRLAPTHRHAKDVSKGGGRSFSHVRILERIGIGHKLHQQPPGAVANHLRRVNLDFRVAVGISTGEHLQRLAALNKKPRTLKRWAVEECTTTA